MKICDLGLAQIGLVLSNLQPVSRLIWMISSSWSSKEVLDPMFRCFVSQEAEVTVPQMMNFNPHFSLPVSLYRDLMPFTSYISSRL